MSNKPKVTKLSDLFALGSEDHRTLEEKIRDAEKEFKSEREGSKKSDITSTIDHIQRNKTEEKRKKKQDMEQKLKDAREDEDKQGTTNLDDMEISDDEDVENWNDVKKLRRLSKDLTDSLETLLKSMSDYNSNLPNEIRETIYKIQNTKDIKDADILFDNIVHFIQDIENNYIPKIKKNKDIPNVSIGFENLNKICEDLEYSLNIRVKALLKYNSKYPNDIQEITKKISDSYTISNTTLLLEYVIAICQESEIGFIPRVECAKVLALNNPIGYEVLNEIYNEMRHARISTPYKVETIMFLFRSKEFSNEACSHLCEIINDNSIDCEFRYKAILLLEKKVENSEKYILTTMLSFISNSNNDPIFRILAGQYLMSECKENIEKKDVEKVENILLEIAKGDEEDSEVDENREAEEEDQENSEEKLNEYNLRADATDVLLSLGGKKAKKEATKIMLKLGYAGARFQNIYTNAQNVHNVSIAKSAITSLEYLHTIESKDKEGNELTIKEVISIIKKMLKNEKVLKTHKKLLTPENIKKIISSLGRVILDRATYSRFNINLANILLKVWCFIDKQEDNKEELIKRLFEELVDMCGTCSSGYAERLVNVMSGYTDVGISMSFEDQVIANLSGRLNARIRDMKNKKLSAVIQEEMAVPVGNYGERKHFLLFFRKIFPIIREELRKEFLTYISEQDFELYLRKAISQYEGEGKEVTIKN